VVRCWEPDTRLNGQAFGDAPLVPGDRLSIGPVELEIVDPARLPQHGGKPIPPESDLEPAHREAFDRLSARLRLVSQQGRDRARRLIRSLRAAREQIAAVRHETPGADFAEKQAELEQAPAVQAGESLALPRAEEPQAPNRPPAASAPTDDEEDSIEQYMTRLIQRIAGLATSARLSGAAAPRPQREEADPQGGDDENAEELSEERSPAAGKPERAPDDLSPRAAAPENSTDMTVKGDRTDLSAWTALDRHARRMLRRLGRGKPVLAAAGLVIGAALLWLWWRWHAG